MTAPTAGGNAVYTDSDARISGDLISRDRAVFVNQRSLAGSSLEPESDLVLNQCLFIQGYIPYKRPLFPPYLRAAAGPHSLGTPQPDSATGSPILAAGQSESGSEASVRFLVEPPRVSAPAMFLQWVGHTERMQAYDPLVETLEYIMERGSALCCPGHWRRLTENDAESHRRSSGSASPGPVTTVLKFGCMCCRRSILLERKY
jgi:hypothetical protein